MHPLMRSTLQNQSFGGLAYIVLAAVVLALGDGLVKLLSAQISVWQLVVLRGLVAVPLLGVFMCRFARHGLRAKHRFWVGVRSLLLVAMWILVYLALAGLALPPPRLQIMTIVTTTAMLSGSGMVGFT